jgi:hypothetical protein
MSSSPLLQGNEKIDKNSAGQNQIVQFVKPDNSVFLDRTELNTKELSLHTLIDISPPFVIKHQKVLGRSSRGFTHHHSLHLRFLLHFVDLSEEGSQKEEGEMRMLQPCHHSQS